MQLTDNSTPGSVGHEPHAPAADASSRAPGLPLVRIGRATITGPGGQDAEVFTMMLDGEKIFLEPHKNWGQLDVHKWQMRGKLPGTPPGLEITLDHVRIAGESIPLKDPEGCAKFEKLIEEWLVLERETIELAKKKAHAKPAAAQVEVDLESLPVRFEVDVGAQVRVRCLRGTAVVANIGLNIKGFESLFSQGLMRKPHKLQVGALRDWVELDGVLFSFEHGNNDAAKLAKALNEHYAPDMSQSRGKDMVVFTNPASSTGFDIQFRYTSGGVSENRRRPLAEDSLEMLLDPHKCGLLREGLVIKLSRPTFIIKQKSPDGGEKYLPKCDENRVVITDDEGKQKIIDLSVPVNYLHLTAMDLTAVFNHPAICKHSKAAPKAAVAPPPPPPMPVAPPLSPAAATPPPARPDSAPAAVRIPPPASAPPIPEPPRLHVLPSEPPPPVPVFEPLPPATPKLQPNAWMTELLAEPSQRYDWFSCLLYKQVAQYFGNSREGKLGLSGCWAVAFSEVKHIEEETFRGVFLTEKHGLGYINQRHMARFNKGVAFIGEQDAAIEGIGITLCALALSAEDYIVFIVSEGYRKKFGLPEPAVQKELDALEEYGAMVMSVKEVLTAEFPISVLWTVPNQQENPEEPQALQTIAPGSLSEEDETPLDETTEIPHGLAK